LHKWLVSSEKHLNSLCETFKPGWKMSFFVLVFTPILVVLGLWQLDREEDKIRLQTRYEERSRMTPLELTELDWSSPDLAYARVWGRGQYDNERHFLLDNRIYEGRVGYELLTPFHLEDASVVLVNRGWLAQGESRSLLPKIEAVTGEVGINATIYVPLDEAFLLNNIEEAHVGDWPRVIQSLKMDAAEMALGIDLAPYSLRLVNNSPGLQQDNWQTVNMMPEKHRAYAAQWLSMAVVLLGLYIYFGFKNARLTKNRE